MTKSTAGRPGRPRLAASSLDEALQAAYAGTAPARPRNDFERQAHQHRPRGPKVKPSSPTRVAAQLAEYLVRTDRRSLASAAKEAAATYGVNADNVRKHARRLLTGPMVKVSYKGQATWAPITQQPMEVPLLLEVLDEDSLQK